MSHNVKNTHVAPDAPAAPAAPSEMSEDTSFIADAISISGTQVVDIEIDRRVASWSVAEYKTRYADTLNAWRFCAMFLDGVYWFMFDRRNVCQDTYIGA